MVVLAQKEVADRLAAGPGGKTYGALSVMAQFRCRVRLLRKVLPGAFTPPPKVDSGLVLFERRASAAVRVDDEAWFFKLTRAALPRGVRRD
jgi:16S rRNA (adenine1518-N6/adenine1519-N6)-dimethyltransferase